MSDTTSSPSMEEAINAAAISATEKTSKPKKKHVKNASPKKKAALRSSSSKAPAKLGWEFAVRGVRYSAEQKKGILSRLLKDTDAVKSRSGKTVIGFKVKRGLHSEVFNETGISYLTQRAWLLDHFGLEEFKKTPKAA